MLVIPTDHAAHGSVPRTLAFAYTLPCPGAACESLPLTLLDMHGGQRAVFSLGFILETLRSRVPGDGQRVRMGIRTNTTSRGQIMLLI